MISYRLAGIACVVSASLFFCASLCHAAANDVIAFGNFGSFSNPANIDPAKTRAEGSAYNLIYNNAIPAISYYSDYDGPPFRGKEGFMRKSENYEFFFSAGNFGLGYALTESTRYDGTGDSVRLLQDLLENTRTPGKTYDDVRLSGIDQNNECLKVYYSNGIPTDIVTSLKVGICAKYIQGSYYQNAGIAGEATQVDESTTNFNFDLEGYFSTGKTIGHGFAIDLGAACRVNDRLSVEMLLENVAGEMLWENLKWISATGNSQNFEVDPDGNLITKPTISGYKFIESFLTRPDFRSIWGAEYKYTDHLSFIGILEPYTDTTYYWAGAQWHPQDGPKLRGGYGSEYDAISFSIEWGMLKCMVSANDINLNKARSLGLLIGLSL